MVTDDLTTTKSEFSQLFGYEWGPEVGGEVAVTLPTGEQVVDLLCAFSITEPRIELVRSAPLPLWEAVPGIHHLGYWSDDVDADRDEFAGQGYSTEATRLAPDGSLFFAFMRSPSGLLLEFVTRVAEPGMSQCWAVPQ
ncbi:VOC family protein [Rhodococcus sp. NPDC060086]|uniref:VOC family protein n=1 Tax=Rhodococcus sp. NPDC060086 TaxID=3347055 RepID=UPI0036482B8A